MIKTPMELRALTQEMTISVWTLGAIAAVFESGLASHLGEPRSVEELVPLCPSLPRGRIERSLALLATTGVVTAEEGKYRLAEGAMPFTRPPLRATLQGDLRSTLMQALAFLDASSGRGPASGWLHTDPMLLQAQGDASAAFPPMFKMNLVAQLGDLGARLDQPGAKFLDVGVGVASLAIGMCGAWPGLHVVGLDVFDAPLAIARENVARAKLGDRVELRKLAVEDLRDEDVFELAWLPSFFVATSAIAKAVALVRASLRPGGWLLLPIGGFTGAERQRATFALVNELWGGAYLSVPEAESLLREAGFTSSRVLPGPPSAPPLLAAQR